MPFNKRTALILIVAILVLAGIGAVLVSTRPVSTTDTNTALTNGGTFVTATEDPVGTPVTASLKLGGGSLEVVKAFRAPTFRITQAGEGREFIVVQFQPLPAGGPDLYAAAADATLTAGGVSYPQRIIELPTVSDNPKGVGTLAFPVPKGATDPVLVLPGGVTLNLPV